MRLIDADANIETMKKCAANPESEQALLCYRFAQKILEEAPTVELASPWHRVEEKLPSAFQDVWAACKMNGRENWTIETTYDPYLSCPWGYKIPVLESGKAVVYAWMDRSAPEPPQEVQDDKP